MQKRKTGIVTAAYWGQTGAAAGFRAMKAHGYDCADYQNFINTSTPLFTLPEGAFARQLQEERDAAADAGIEIYQTHAPWRYPPQDATQEDRAERLEKMKKTIWGTSLLGCRYFVVHPLMPFGPDADPEPERFRAINLEFFAAMLPTAKQYGVTLCLENMPMRALSLSRPAQVLSFVRELPEENIGVCLDTGHCAVFGESPADAVRQLGDRLKVLHVHDNDGRSDWHWQPFAGVINWEDFRKALRASPYAGPLMLETSAFKRLPAALIGDYQRALAHTAKYLAE